MVAATAVFSGAAVLAGVATWVAALLAAAAGAFLAFGLHSDAEAPDRRDIPR